jgi:hypothetical protein
MKLILFFSRRMERFKIFNILRLLKWSQKSRYLSEFKRNGGYVEYIEKANKRIGGLLHLVGSD